MKKFKIFIWHLVVFVIGSGGIILYVFNRLVTPSSGAGLGGVVVMPVIILVYVIAFGILCSISMVIWFLVSYFRNRIRK